MSRNVHRNEERSQPQQRDGDDWDVVYALGEAQTSVLYLDVGSWKSCRMFGALKSPLVPPLDPPYIRAS